MRWFQLLALPPLFFFHALSVATPAYIELDSIVTQVPLNKVASALKFDTIDEQENMLLAPSQDKVVIQVDGIYFVSAIGQIGATSRGAAGNMDLWLVKNGQDVVDSSVRRSLSPYIPMSIISTTFLLPLSAGDTLGAAFSASGPSLGFLFFKPDNEPAITSFTLSLFKINSD
jgi:hypothetical protein